jgi:hypothetical protein
MLVALTYTQVREAGLFAWRGDDFIYTPSLDRILGVVSRTRSEQHPNGVLDIVASSVLGDEPGMLRDWHHVRECQCAYCRAGRLRDDAREDAGRE